MSSLSELIFKDKVNDLELIKVKFETPTFAMFRSGKKVRPGDSVVAFGFPLMGLLSSSGALTTGTITALAGLGDDTRMLQMTAPVQPGNSGGPLIDLYGHVIGVVNSKLNTLSVAKLTGDISQNINFVLKSQFVEIFLENADINAQTNPSKERLEPADVGEIASKLSYLVECSN